MTLRTSPRTRDTVLHAPRVTGDDDLFIRMDRALGVPLANQVTWLLHEPIDPHRFAEIGRRLARTPLNRVLHRNRIPCARDVWVDAGPGGSTVGYDLEPIADDGVIDWMNACAATDFDLETGPVWSLRAARLRSGGGAVTLTSNHAVGDGWSGVRNVCTAVDATAAPQPLPSSAPSTGAHLRDAAGQVARVTENLGRLALDLTRGRGSARPDVITSQSISRPAADSLPHDADVAPPLAIVSLDSAQWHHVARQHGGTSNALFIAITAGLVVAAGRAGWDDHIRVVVPISDRTQGDGDLRANVTTGGHLDLPTDLSRHKDLAAIRSLAKQMYRDPRPDPLARLQPLAQSLPDAALLRLHRNAATPLAVASNVGEFDDRFTTLGAENVKAVALRSVPQRTDVARLAALRGGIACWLNTTGATTTLTVGSYDPLRIPSRAALTSLLTEECGRWGLTPTLW